MKHDSNDIHNDQQIDSSETTAAAHQASPLDRFFKLTQRGSSVKTEFIAGVTTFLSMAYILAVNPEILGRAGMNRPALFTATVLSSLIASLIMGLFANLPVALAPGMGLNAFFTYTVVLAWHIPWQTALAGVLAAGLLFFLLSLTRFLKELINAIPMSLKYAISAGIGLFIAFSGLQSAQIIVPDRSNGIALGNLHSPAVLLALFGIFVTIVLVTKKVTGGIFIGMVITALVGMLTRVIALPHTLLDSVPSIQPLLGQSIENIGNINSLQMLIVVLTFFFIGIFDTAGTVLAVITEANLSDKQGNFAGSKRALVSASLATTIGSVLGTSTTTAYAESTSGVAMGGRTGLTAVVAAAFFGIASFFSPLLSVVTSAVTVPALVIVGILMMKNVQYIDWEKIEIAVPAFFTIVMMSFTYSISQGLAFGFILYPLTMALTHRSKEVHPIMYVLMILFIVYFIFVLQ